MFKGPVRDCPTVRTGYEYDIKGSIVCHVFSQSLSQSVILEIEGHAKLLPCYIPYTVRYLDKRRQTSGRVHGS